MYECVPDDARRVEDGTVKARTHEMWCAVDMTRQDHAAVATAKPAAHDLLERHVTSPPMRRGKLGDGTHHWRRAARVQAECLRRWRGPQRRLECRSHEPARAAAAVF